MHAPFLRLSRFKFFVLRFSSVERKKKMIIVIGFAVNLAHRARTWRLPPTVNCFLFFLFD